MSAQLTKRWRLVAVLVVAAALALAAPGLIAGTNDGGCCGGMASMATAHQGSAMLSGTVTAIDKRDGSVTVTLRPATAGGEAAKKALSGVKVGDTLSLAMMLKAGTASHAAKYVCPMHPEVTSDKPGKCPKCGMDLERTKAK